MLVGPVSLRQAITKSGHVEWNRNCLQSAPLERVSEEINQPQQKKKKRKEPTAKIGHYRKIPRCAWLRQAGWE
jgi:hypothetical protein